MKHRKLLLDTEGEWHRSEAYEVDPVDPWGDAEEILLQKEADSVSFDLENGNWLFIPMKNVYLIEIQEVKD